jgi:plasmid stabilization system protein ParE
MRVRYTLRAFTDRETIFDYLENRNPSAAGNVKRAIEKRAIEQAIEARASHPRVGQPTDKPGITN